MKRSQINATIQKAKSLLEEYRWALPDWAMWSVEDYDANPELAAWLRAHQMGWDVTDFNCGDFRTRGLGLFCVRNGLQSDPDSMPYAEKLLFVEEEQETPFHTHKVKLEDIINRGGGTLVIEFRRAEGDDRPIEVRCDGHVHSLERDEPLELATGHSVTIPRGLYHRFYGKKGGGMVLGGEVSQVNDDGADNYFWEELGRFSDVEEDEAPLHPLWNEIGA